MNNNELSQLENEIERIQSQYNIPQVIPLLRLPLMAVLDQPLEALCTLVHAEVYETHRQESVKQHHLPFFLFLLLAAEAPASPERQGDGQQQAERYE